MAHYAITALASFRGRLGKWRLIVDLSYPQGANFNHSIDGKDFPLSYSRVEDAIDFIMKEGRGLHQILCLQSGDTAGH